MISDCLVKKVISVFIILSMLATSAPVYASWEDGTQTSYLLSSEHQTTLNSLFSQINSTGIGVWAVSEEDVLSPSGINHRTRVVYEIAESVTASYDSEQTAVIKFSLLNPHEQEVSFDYAIYPGSAGSERYNVPTQEGTVTFGAGERSIELEIAIPKLDNNPVEYGTASDPGDFWTGDKVFYINCRNIRNALFANDRETLTVPVSIENQFDLQEAYINAVGTPLVDLDDPTKLTGAKSFPEEPGKYQHINEEDGNGLIRITGASLEGDLRTMIDMGVFSHLSMPVGYFSFNTDGDGETGTLGFRVDKYITLPSGPSEPIGPISAFEQVITVEANKETDFSLGESGKVGLAQIRLGRSFEENGLVKSLDFLFTYSILSGDIFTFFHDGNGNYIPKQVYFSDQIGPRAESVTIPEGSFYPGESIPIIVRYSEPVLTDDIILTANDQLITPVERKGTISETVSFLYEIDGNAEGESAIQITSITGGVDLGGNQQEPAGEYNLTYSLGAFKPEKALSYYGATSVNINPGEAQGEIILSIGNNTELNDWLKENTQADNLVSVVKAKVVGKDGLPVEISLYANEGLFITQLKGEFEVPSDASEKDISYVAEIYVDIDPTDAQRFELVYGLSKLYTVSSLIYIDDESDLEIIYTNWPSTNRISADSVVPITLGYQVNVNATWQSPEDFSWESNNTAVATINPAGGITLTGHPGTVSFTLKAHNGGLGDEFSLSSKILDVVDAESGFLVVPEAVQNIEVVKGSAVNIHYSTNLILRNDLFVGSGTTTPFTYTLYEAVYTGTELQKGELLHQETLDATVEEPLLVYALAPEYLVKTTPKGKYGYILEISAKDRQSERVFSATANVRVKESPVKAVLQKPQTYYQTDADPSFAVSFQIENSSPDTELLLTVVKNQDPEPLFSTQSTADIGKEHRISITPVDHNRLLDVYTISLKAKNDSSEAFSYDSYTLYVYNADALKIMVNGEAKTQLTMSLENELSKMSSREILDLNRKIRPAEEITINNKEYKWSRIADQIIWEVGDEGKISLKYNDGGIYRNIQDYSLPGFLPGASFMLEGISSGSTSVTATHGLTGMKARLDVNVDRLEDKLFIFQVYPEVECEVTYRNGDGENKSVKTDSAGRFAVYEKSSIASDVIFRPTGSYGTYDYAVLKHQDLMANQNEAKEFGLYPQNNVTLPRMNYKVTLQLFDSETQEQYDKDLVIRGGVYRNGVYCPSATINDKKGSEDQIVKYEHGSYILNFNPEEFFSAKDFKAPGPEDKIEYIIELRFPEGSHYNKFIKIDSESVRKYRSSSMGVFEMETITPLDSSNIKDKFTVISQTTVIDDQEQPMAGEFYFEKMPERAVIRTDMMIPGAHNNYYWTEFVDEYGLYWDGSPATQKTYEFSDTVILSSTLDIRYQLARLKQGEEITLYINVRTADLSMQMRMPDPIKIRNLIEIPSIGESLQKGDLADLAKEIIDTAKGPADVLKEDDEVRKALDFISQYSLSTNSVRLEIEPTKDPLVYKGVIKFAAGDLTRENPSGVFSSNVEGKEKFSFMPGLSEMKAMKKGTFKQKSQETMQKNLDGANKAYKTYGGGAYLECEIYYDLEEKEWKILTLVSDVYLGAGGGYVRKHNTMVGPVPVTAEFRAGFTAQAGFKNYVEKEYSRDGKEFDLVDNYITELRPYFYLYGFGGLGYDVEVSSLKIGPYGKVSLDQRYLWHNRKEESKNGQKLTIAGTTGVKFEATAAFFIKYTKNYKIASAEKSWKYNDFDEIYELYTKTPKSRMMLGASLASYPEVVLEPGENKATFEDRTYLEIFTRQWGSPKSRSFGPLGYSSPFNTTGVNILETNTYPNANPVLADDGSIMVYLSDMNSGEIKDTAVNYTIRNGDGSYSEGGEISPADYPDSDAVIAGTAEGAVTAWNRIFSDFSKGAGEEATSEDAVKILSGTEIMVGVYKEDKFTIKQLTNNSTPDIAPVVATNGDKAIVAWRSVSVGDRENFLDFEQDNIMYSIFDGIAWSEAKCLYEGSTDKVKALNVAMLSDGTAAVTYEIEVKDKDIEEVKDTEDEFTVNNTEIICAILDTKGEVTNIRLTNNTSRDRNPRITAVEFPDEAERFVIGWNALRELDSGDLEDTVRLAALNGDGRLYSEFDMEIVDTAGGSNYQSFKFAKGASKLEELSIFWTEPEMKTDTTSSDSVVIHKDNIWGKQFLWEEDGNYALSGKLKLVELPENNGVDSFDCYVDTKNKELNFSLLLSEISAEGTRADMATAKAAYQNSLVVKEPYFSYQDILPGLDMPILFRLYNEGVEPISQVTINLAGETHTFDEKTHTLEKIKPGEHKDFTVLYKVPEIIVNPEYSIAAKFATTEDTIKGTLKLDLPDVAIYQIDVTKETERERRFRVQLRNNAYAKLEAGKHVVKVEVYNSPDFLDNLPLVIETFPDAESLGKINEGTLSLDVTLKEEDLQGILDASGEIPEDGARIFFRAIIEEKETPKEKGIPIEDADIANDMDYVKIHSLLTQKGTPVSIASMMVRETNQTLVQVEAFNNSMNKITDGNIIVNLKDQQGRILETQQIYNREAVGKGLVSVDGEEITKKTFSFNTLGSSMEAIFAKVVLDSSKLSVLKFSGVPLVFKQDVYQYDLRVRDLRETNLTLVAENPEAKITVLKNGTPVSLAVPCSLFFGANEFIITVKAGDDEVTYTLNIYNESNGNGNGGEGNGGGGNDDGGNDSEESDDKDKSTDSEASEKPAAPSISGVIRISGSTRVDTALAIAKAAFPGTVSNAVLTTMANYPDALAGSVLAYKLNGPILLIGNSAEDQEKVMEYLESSLEPGGTVYILGGSAIVSRDIEDKLIDAGIKRHIRIHGADRYETAVNIVKQLEVEEGTPVVLVSGENFPDALSISSIAAQSQFPVLLVSKDGMSDVVKKEIAKINPEQVFIIGQQGVISSAVEDQIAQIIGLESRNITRIGGANRYETALAVAQYFDYDSETVCIATGRDFPDALAGSVLAAIYKAPIILTDDNLSEQAIDYLQSKKTTGTAIFGGQAAVGQEIVQQLKQLLK